jgi:hypothetical protein
MKPPVKVQNNFHSLSSNLHLRTKVTHSAHTVFVYTIRFSHCASCEVRTEVRYIIWKNFSLNSDPCGGGLEYLHRNPVSRKGRQKGNPVPGGRTVPPCSWGI